MRLRKLKSVAVLKMAIGLRILMIDADQERARSWKLLGNILPREVGVHLVVKHDDFRFRRVDFASPCGQAFFVAREDLSHIMTVKSESIGKCGFKRTAGEDETDIHGEYGLSGFDLEFWVTFIL